MSSKPTSIGSAWNLAVLWNKAIESMPERPLVPRDYMWASELGQSYLTRYLRMYGVPMTNPPNARSRRKFIAGHIWEFIIRLVLTNCGVLKSCQQRVELKFPGMLRVSGKTDFVAGGEVNWDEAKEKIKDMQGLFDHAAGEMPEFIFHAIQYIVADLEKSFKKNPLKKVIFECKSISSFMFNKVEKTGAMPHHVLQAGTYIAGKPVGGGEQLDEVYIVYICKDDTLMQQFDLKNSEPLIKALRADCKKMTEYYNLGFDPQRVLAFAPPKDDEFLFTEGYWRFEKNFNVEYSPYLTMLYGYKDPEEYRIRWQYKLQSWNRVFKRVVTGENITPKNEVIIKQASNEFPDWVKMVKKAKAAGAFKDASDDQEDEA